MREVKNIRVLLYESIACWYQLQWLSSSAIIVIRIHEAYLATLKDVPTTSPLVCHLESQFGLKQDLLNSGFCGAFGADSFGFNRALVKQPRRSGDPFVEYWAKIPVVWFDTHETCRYCEGRKNQALSDRCYHCSGSGKSRDCDWARAHELQTSLVILLALLNVPPEIDVQTDKWQALSVEMVAIVGPSGSGVWGEMSPNTVEYLRGLSTTKLDGLIDEVSEAVMIAYATMIGKPSDPCQFRKHLSSDGIHFDCPGNATGIDGSFDRGHRESYGAKFSPHNVDSSLQGLSLFAGVARLSELTQFWLKREVVDSAK
jgi:hypothetical protein